MFLDREGSFLVDFKELVSKFSRLTLIFDTGVWKPVSKYWTVTKISQSKTFSALHNFWPVFFYFRLEDAKPQKFEKPLSYKNRSDLSDDQYMILEKRSRSHLLCSVTSENPSMNASRFILELSTKLMPLKSK